MSTELTDDQIERIARSTEQLLELSRRNKNSIYGAFVSNEAMERWKQTQTNMEKLRVIETGETNA